MKSRNLIDFFRAMAATREEVEQLKRDFMAMVSHDLRTPLSSIQMVHGLLESGAYGALNEKGMASLAIAEDNVNHLMKLVNDLLDMEKLESGKLQLELASIDLSEVIESSAHAVEGYAKRLQVNVQVQSADNLMVLGERDRLVQVMVNLLSNAIKFSQPNDTVVVAGTSTDKSAEVKVIDTGRGIPAEHLESIFDRFQQVSIDDARLKGGSGLGLAICKSIVEQHNGSIGVISEVGKGSTFWWRLPLSSQQQPTQRQSATLSETHS